MMAVNFFAGFFLLIASILYVCAGIVSCASSANSVMVIFRINDYLGAIRDRGEPMHSHASGRPVRSRSGNACTSPSLTTYSLPSSRSLPASRAPASLDSAT